MMADLCWSHWANWKRLLPAAQCPTWDGSLSITACLFHMMCWTCSQLRQLVLLVDLTERGAIFYLVLRVSDFLWAFRYRSLRPPSLAITTTKTHDLNPIKPGRKMFFYSPTTQGEISPLMDLPPPSNTLPAGEL